MKEVSEVDEQKSLLLEIAEAKHTEGAQNARRACVVLALFRGEWALSTDYER
jgi:hypothetical protein